MNTITNLQDHRQFYASADLLAELQTKLFGGATLINFAYTDYGGQFFDKVCIAFFTEHYPDSIVKEQTQYYGENAFLFGPVATEFLEKTENYPLGFDGLEDYFMNMESEERQKGIVYFLDSLDKDKYTVSEEIPEAFYEYVESYCNVLTSGLDYSESDMIAKGIETGLLTKTISAE